MYAGNLSLNVLLDLNRDGKALPNRRQYEVNDGFLSPNGTNNKVLKSEFEGFKMANLLNLNKTQVKYTTSR